MVRSETILREVNMRKNKICKLGMMLLVFIASNVYADIKVKKVNDNLAEDFANEKIWQSAEADQIISLMGQPMAVPKPKETLTTEVKVTALHDGKWIAFRMKWKDSEPSEAGKLATFSDAVALEFPLKESENLPPIMMGAKDAPVHLFHWRYQYQLDEKNGKKSIEKIYPNMTTDMYAMDFKDAGNSKVASQEQKDSFVGGMAAGNPQSFQKTAVDEILAEGFGTSAVMEKKSAKGFGVWKDGEWTVVIARPLNYEQASNILIGKKSNVGFAVWQGGKKEVGGIKSLTMMWTPLEVLEK